MENGLPDCPPKRLSFALAKGHREALKPLFLADISASRSLSPWHRTSGHAGAAAPKPPVYQVLTVSLTVLLTHALTPLGGPSEGWGLASSFEVPPPVLAKIGRNENVDSSSRASLPCSVGSASSASSSTVGRGPKA
jgi:hypothetical protein